MTGRLVVISGHPAAGKSTLARRLAADLGAPVVQRDRLRRDVLFPILEAHPQIRPMIPSTLDRLVSVLVEEILDAGATAILDGNFNTPEHAAAVRRRLAERSDPPACVEVCLWGEPDVLRERFIARADPPLTDDLRPYFESVVARERLPVLAPPTPIVHLDTTEFSALDAAYPELLTSVRTALEGIGPGATSR